MKVQCACGGAYVGWSKRYWLIWLDHHACAIREPAESESDSEGTSYIHGDAQVERSYQYNGTWDGERHIHEVNARHPIGLAVE